MHLLDGQVHPDTHPIPMGNYVIAVGNYVIATPSQVGNYKIADTQIDRRSNPAVPASVGLPAFASGVPHTGGQK